MLFYHLFNPNYFRTAFVALAALPTPHSSSVSSLALETSASPCTHFTLSNWKEAIGLPGKSLEFGDDAQMWIYMHHDGADINDSPEFENAFGRLQMQDPNLSCGTVNCAVDPVLCNSWLASPPTVMHISHEFHTPLVAPRAEWRRIFLADSNSSATDMESLYRDQRWRDNAVWDGFLHPYTGALGKYGGGQAWGVFKFWLDKVPRWFLGIVATLMIKRFLQVQPLLFPLEASKLNASDEPMISAAYQIVPPENLR
ncbi:hypothetical protein V495_08351 [Pseudogymnoascus sp. VKM F-4514 (FW-929)]|nr:hypothetical protein V495_08351 [Pseudogymnoascus sp. VKM F-4514 (FW-929)]